VLSESGNEVRESTSITFTERMIRILGLQVIGFDGAFNLVLVAIVLWMTQAVEVPFDPLFTSSTYTFAHVMTITFVPVALLGIAIVLYRNWRRKEKAPFTGLIRQSYLDPVNLVHFLRIIALLYLSTMSISNLKPLIWFYNPRLYDDFFRKLDYYLFFKHDIFKWLAQFRQPWLQSLMDFGYMSLFYMSFVTMSILFIQKRYQPLRALVLAMLLAKAVGNAIHFLIPTVGDCYWPGRLHLYDEIQTRFLTRQIQLNMYAILNDLKQHPQDFIPFPYIGIAAFPSLHAAQIVLYCHIAWRYAKWLLVAYIPLSILLMVSTMYFGWHYLSDLIAGTLLGLVMIPLCRNIIAANLKLVRRNIPNPLPEVSRDMI
jgi:membrane-associated phospholipid phosphatase